MDSMHRNSGDTLRLELLGRAELRRASGEAVSSILTLPKRFALLVFLTLEGGRRFVRRDEILAMFWPESDEDRARQSLRQALHTLRSALGREVVLARGGGELAIDTGRLQCDALDFHAAADRGDHAAALEFYPGDLLPGFHCPGVPAFIDLLDGRRREFRRMALSAAESEVARLESAGAYESAASAARRAVGLSDHDEAAAVRLIGLLIRAGDRIGARAAFDELTRVLHEEYDSAPSPALLELLAGSSQPPVQPAPEKPPESAGRPDVSKATTASLRPATPTARNGAHKAAATWRRGLVAVMAVPALLTGLYVLFTANSVSRLPGNEDSPLLLAIEPLTGSDSAALALGEDISASLRQIFEPGRAMLPSVRLVLDARQQAVDLADVVMRGSVLGSTTHYGVQLYLADARSGALLESLVVQVPASPGEQPAALADLRARVRHALGRERQLREWYSQSPRGDALRFVRFAVADRERGDSLRLAGARAAALAAFASSDSLLLLAEARAPGWGEPIHQRTETALRRMWFYLLADSVPSARAALHDGLQTADRLLKRQPRKIAALEARAVISYWLLITTPHEALGDPSAAARSVEQNLRAVVLGAPERPRSWALLSSLLRARGAFAEAYLAAERAYAADDFLEPQTDILVRLFETALESGDHVAAARWCGELERVRNSRWVHAWCQLLQLAWPVSVDARAAAEADAIVAASAAHTPPTMMCRLHMIAAVAASRAGDPVLAGFHVARAQAADAGSTDLLSYMAWLEVTRGRHSEATRLLRAYRDAEPLWWRGVARSSRYGIDMSALD